MRALTAWVLAGAVSGLLGGAAHRKSEEGKRRFEEGVFDDALRAFTEAQVAAPESPLLQYDVGSTLYKQGNFSGAAEALGKALATAPPPLAPAAAYNLGNALYRQERYDEAVEAYRRALREAPGDADAKRNLEMALRAVQLRKNPQPQPQPQQQPREDSKKNEQQRKAGGEGDEAKKPQQAPGGGEPSPKPTPDRGDRSGSSTEKRPGEMTPDEARQLLDRLKDEERRNLKREAARKARSEDDRLEKDW